MGVMRMVRLHQPTMIPIFLIIPISLANHMETPWSSTSQN